MTMIGQRFWELIFLRSTIYGRPKYKISDKFPLVVGGEFKEKCRSCGEENIRLNTYDLQYVNPCKCKSYYNTKKYIIYEDL